MTLFYKVPPPLLVCLIFCNIINGSIKNIDPMKIMREVLTLSVSKAFLLHTKTTFEFLLLKRTRSKLVSHVWQSVSVCSLSALDGGLMLTADCVLKLSLLPVFYRSEVCLQSMVNRLTSLNSLSLWTQCNLKSQHTAETVAFNTTLNLSWKVDSSGEGESTVTDYL